MDVTYFDSADELRAWFENHHDNVDELWVGFRKKGSDKPSVSYPEAVEQALCFGWIDGVRKSVDSESYVNRFTPRKPKSGWSAINVRRVEHLMAAGLMHPSGLHAYEQRDTDAPAYAYTDVLELDADSETRFKANRRAWDFFQAQSDAYRRVASRWVMSAKQEPTRKRRLATLIEDSQSERRLGLLRTNS